MINKKFVAIVLAMGLFLSMGCVVSRQPGPQDAFGAQDVFGESDNSWQQEAGSTFSVVVDDINIGQAYSGNSEPVTILVRIVENPRVS